MEKVFKTLSFHVRIHLKVDEFYGARYLTSNAWLVSRRSCCLIQRSQCLGFSNWSIVLNQAFLVVFSRFLETKTISCHTEKVREKFKKTLLKVSHEKLCKRNRAKGGVKCEALPIIVCYCLVSWRLSQLKIANAWNQFDGISPLKGFTISLCRKSWWLRICFRGIFGQQ